jgi:c-di-GMP-related signal transduction protein
MKTAIIRGRFAELLGLYLLPRNEAENLFVAGMFSMLDRLLGMTMDEALAQIPLSEALCQALLSRQGIYGPFLALAESCEQPDGDSAALADALFLSAEQVNRAHLAALGAEPEAVGRLSWRGYCRGLLARAAHRCYIPALRVRPKAWPVTFAVQSSQ